MSMEKIYELVKELPEVYQDIVVGNIKMLEGRRGCDVRYGGVVSNVGPHSVILDLGSSTGYFSRGLALDYPDSLILSVESDTAMCEIQREICEHDGIYNVVICNYRMGVAELRNWSKCVVAFDAVLALSVLHHFPPENVREVVKILRSMTYNLFIETPGVNEETACGGEAKNEVMRAMSRLACEDYGSEVVARTPSHLGNHTRDTIRYVNSVHRSGLDAYMGVSHEGRHKFDLEAGYGAWRLNDRSIIPGLTVWDVLQFNVVWPRKEWWISQARRAYEGLSFKSDVRLWNLIITSTGLKAIDYMTRFPQGDQAEYKPSDYTVMEEKLSEYIS